MGSMADEEGSGREAIGRRCDSDPAGGEEAQEWPRQAGAVGGGQAGKRGC